MVMNTVHVCDRELWFLWLSQAVNGLVVLVFCAWI